MGFRKPHKRPDGNPADNLENDNAYSVGYARPPKATQFKPGQSGNPKGRPKGQRSLRTVVNAALNKRVLVHEGERAQRISKREAFFHVMLTRALKGDHRASAQLVRVLAMMGDFNAPQANAKEDHHQRVTEARARLNDILKNIAERRREYPSPVSHADREKSD